MFSYSTGYYVSPPDDQYLKFKNRCSLLSILACSMHRYDLSPANPLLALQHVRHNVLSHLLNLSNLSYALRSLFCSFISGKFWAKINFIIRRVPSFCYISLSVPFRLQFSFHFALHSLLARFDAKQWEEENQLRFEWKTFLLRFRLILLPTVNEWRTLCTVWVRPNRQHLTALL